MPISQKKRRKNKKKRVLKKLGRLFLFMVILAFAFTTLFCTAVCLFTEPLDTEMLNFNMASVIYYENDIGEKVAIQRLSSAENRTWVEFDNIPLDMQNAFVAIEDERFYSHPGFDLKRLGGAVLNTALRVFDRNRSVYGGSTITQQLVKNLTKEDERSILRKAKEIYRAIRLEQDLSKNQILELYLNTIYLSQNCNGVAAASKVYFNKDISDLSLAECASIAGITQFPSRYDPYLNPEANKQKQELVLGKMLELEMITSEEYEEAMEEELVFDRAEEYNNTHYSYFVDTVIEEVLNDLETQYGYTPAMAQNLLYTGGLQIKCTIDRDIQANLEKVYTDQSNYIYNRDQLLQSAMIITEASSGEIKAIVGGMGDKSGSRTYNRAYALRQPGSAIKPLAIYAPAIDSGFINSATILKDEPTTFTLSDGTTWTPKNSGGKFSGDVSLRTAIARSLNIPAAKILNDMGIDRSFKFLSQNLGITTLVERRSTSSGIVSDKSLSLSLGGLTDGVSPMEISAAYATFINDGIYIEPHSYTEIYDHDDNLLYTKKINSHRAMKSTTATIMTDLMTSVVTTGGTGASAAFSGVEIAGKTGTTDSNLDKWFVGLTPSLVGVTWVGYDSPTSINAYGNPAANLWRKVMSQVSYRNKPTKFSSVLSFKGLESYDICTVSGLLASDLCKDLETCYSVYLESKTANTMDECTEKLHIAEEEIVLEGSDISETPDDVSPPEVTSVPADSSQSLNTETTDTSVEIL